MTTPNEEEEDFDDPEVDALNEAEGDNAASFYWRNMEGEVVYSCHAERTTCGGGGVIRCYCGGDLCVCANGGEIECDGCEDCQPDGYDDDCDHYDAAREGA